MNRLDTEKLRLIKLLKANPGKYSFEALRPIIHLCVPTMKKVVEDNDLLIKQRGKGKPKKRCEKKRGFFYFNKLDDIF